MAYIKGLEGTFDKAATLYDKMRPGYSDELYRAIFDYAKVGPESNALEVGPGTGQATLPMLKTGCALTAVEYGENLASRLKEKFSGYPGFTVITDKFEDAPLEKDNYDLVYSATAFHWIPEKEGYEKVYSILKRGGVFARFANRPRPGKDDPALQAEIEDLYDRYYYPYHGKTREPVQEFTEEKARELSEIALRYGFTDLRYHVFHRERVFTAGEYIGLLGTYSDHIAIAEPVRKEFFAAIERAIDARGGTITIHDTLDLELARKN